MGGAWRKKLPAYASTYHGDENGCVDVPEGPGLGVPFDWDFIDAHKTGETVFD